MVCSHLKHECLITAWQCSCTRANAARILLLGTVASTGGIIFQLRSAWSTSAFWRRRFVLLIRFISLTWWPSIRTYERLSSVDPYLSVLLLHIFLSTLCFQIMNYLSLAYHLRMDFRQRSFARFTATSLRTAWTFGPSSCCQLALHQLFLSILLLQSLH